jgi:anti-sigma factor RsiW
VDHAHVSQLLGAYALDACDDAEYQAVEAHLAECPECAEEAGRLKELAGWIGVSEATAPAPELRSRVLRRAQIEDQPDDRCDDSSGNQRDQGPGLGKTD